MEHIKTIAYFKNCAVATRRPISEFTDRQGMTDHRVFIPQDVADVFNANFLDYEFARIWILKRLHPDGAHCPGCGVVIPDNKLQRFWLNQRISCRVCGKYFTALTGTFIAGCQIDFRGLILLSFLLAIGIHDQIIARIIGISKENVRLWRLKFINVAKTGGKS